MRDDDLVAITDKPRRRIREFVQRGRQRSLRKERVASDQSAGGAWSYTCLVASPISGRFSRSASDFVKLTGELDAVLRYEVETAAGEAV